MFCLWVERLKRDTHMRLMHTQCHTLAHWAIIVKKLIMLLLRCAFPVPSCLQHLIMFVMQYISSHTQGNNTGTHINLQTYVAMNTEGGHKETNIKHYILPKCCCCSFQLTEHWFTTLGRTCLYQPQRHYTHPQIHIHVCVHVSNNQIRGDKRVWNELRVQDYRRNHFLF